MTKLHQSECLDIVKNLMKTKQILKYPNYIFDYITVIITLRNGRNGNIHHVLLILAFDTPA